MNLWLDYMRLWQSSWMKLLGMRRRPGRRAGEGRRALQGRGLVEELPVRLIKQSLPDRRAPHPRRRWRTSRACTPESEKKVAFFTRQYVDALSPSNFLLTNPQVLRETVASGGQNLVRGLNNLLDDIEKGGGKLRISMTDENAFQLGATSPPRRARWCSRTS